VVAVEEDLQVQVLLKILVVPVNLVQQEQDLVVGLDTGMVVMVHMLEELQLGQDQILEELDIGWLQLLTLEEVVVVLDHLVVMVDLHMDMLVQEVMVYKRQKHSEIQFLHHHQLLGLAMAIK